MSTYIITLDPITPSSLGELFRSNKKLELSDEVIRKVENCRTYLDQKIASSKSPIYGVNTGFGALYDKSVSSKDLETLQHNLVVSHACGTGDEVPVEIVRLMLFLKIKGMSYGNSGIHPDTLLRLVEFYNEGITPVVFEQGSLGASGDLSPLAHLSLPLIGLGEVNYKGKKITAAEALNAIGKTPLQLQSKEGLALLNGTQFMSSYGVHLLLKASKLVQWADLIGAISLEAYDGRIEPFHPNIHNIRPHAGQVHTAQVFQKILHNSEIIKQEKKHVQDPYSLRCIPQVHGASKDAFNYIYHVITTEINSVTDNPTVFPHDDLVISAGNFHGQPLAIPLDVMSIAMAELGSISERRTYLLVSGQRELPPFLVANAGLNSGFMIPQYTAASLVSQNKQLCTPASVDSITSSNGQEDHVSMGANAATKALRVADNLERILAIELLTAVQALEFRRPLRSSEEVEKIVSDFRTDIPFMEKDRLLHDDIIKSIEFLKSNTPPPSTI